MTRLRCLQALPFGRKAIDSSVPFKLLLVASLLHSVAAAVQTVAFQQGRQLSSGVYNGTKDCQINTQYADTWNYGNGGAAFYQSGSWVLPQPDWGVLCPQLSTADASGRARAHRSNWGGRLLQLSASAPSGLPMPFRKLHKQLRLKLALDLSTSHLTQSPIPKNSLIHPSTIAGCMCTACQRALSSGQHQSMTARQQIKPTALHILACTYMTGFGPQCMHSSQQLNVAGWLRA
jgi:hypothetical protein